MASAALKATTLGKQAKSGQHLLVSSLSHFDPKRTWHRRSMVILGGATVGAQSALEFLARRAVALITMLGENGTDFHFKEFAIRSQDLTARR